VTATSRNTSFREWKRHLRKMFEERDTILILGLSGLSVFFLKEGFLEQIKDDREGLVAAQHEYLQENALFNLRFEVWKLKQERAKESAGVTPPNKTLEASVATLDEERELLRRRCEIEKDLSLATIRSEEQEKEFQEACDRLADAYKFTPKQDATAAAEIERVQSNIDLIAKKVSTAEIETETILQRSRKDSEGVSHFYDTLTTFIFRTLLILSCVSLVAKLVGKDEAADSA
jgi:hypothetical protein